MRTLPTLINRDLYGYRVTIQRGGVKYRAFVPYTRPDALARAVAHRDRFLQIVGDVRRIVRKAKSNTGLVGISETVKLYKNKSLECFAVDWTRDGRHFNRRITYGAHRPRARALREAIALRSRMAGVPSRILQPESCIA